MSEHVKIYSKNKFEKLVHLVGFIIRSYSFVIKLEMTAKIEQNLPLLIFVTKWPLHIFK